MKKAVLFDMDGVLIDSEPVYAQCLSMAFSQAGYPIPAVDFYRFAGVEFRTKFETVIQERGLSLAAEELAAPYRAAQEKLLLDFGPMLKKGTLSVLKRLRKDGYRLALCSNSGQERVDKVFQDTGMKELFDLIITGDQVSKRKPDPGVYLLAMELLELPAAYCLAVEDSIYGIQAAKSAGLTVAALRDERFPYIEKSAEYVITDLAQLHPILEGLL